MPLDMKVIQDYLDRAEQEMEIAKAHVSRCDGAVQMLKHLIQAVEQESRDGSN